MTISGIGETEVGVLPFLVAGAGPRPLIDDFSFLAPRLAPSSSSSLTSSIVYEEAFFGSSCGSSAGLPRGLRREGYNEFCSGGGDNDSSGVAEGLFFFSKCTGGRDRLLP